jgi:hypothetical protein
VPAGSDAALSIPVAVFHGAKPGPVLALVSGAHGTEYASIVALEKVIVARRGTFGNSHNCALGEYSILRAEGAA